MTVNHSPTTHSLRDEVDAELAAAVRAALPAVAVGVAVVLSVWTVIHLTNYPRPRSVMLAEAAAVSAVILSGLALFLHRRRVPLRWANPLAVVVLLIAQFNCFLPPAISPRISHFTDALICIIGAGCVFLSSRWLALAVGSTLGWWFLFTSDLWSHPRWLVVNMELAAASVLSFVIMEIRRRSFGRFLFLKNEAQSQQRAAQQANHAKSLFLANMSHEIRTPLTAILGFTEWLLDEDHHLSAEERKSTLGVIRRNSEHLLILINDVLDLAKIEARKMNVERINVSPRQVVEEVVAMMQGRAAAKGLRLETDWPSSLPASIQTDPIRLRQILLNLVGNAIKFTPTGGVKLSVWLNESAGEAPRLQIAVSDTGVGISPEQVKTLFRPFTQADASTTRQYGGTGLGLAISKRLAEALGGDVMVESQLGQGSTFTVSIAAGPLKGVPWIDPRAPSPTDQPAQETSAEENSTSDAALKGCSILLAEDGPDNQRLISLLLRKAGAEVTVVENGRQAVEQFTVDGTVDGALAQTPLFDLVLMDMQMPEMDGYIATKRLRAKGCPVPIVALTAHAMSGEREKCLAAGCDDYLTKPIDRWLLIQSVAQRVEGRKSESRKSKTANQTPSGLSQPLIADS